jgi:YebC/PmpR family DNA-binding regulatory protein
VSGHSHWSKIKRAKGANDSKRGKIWSKIARKIIIAARSGGDPRDNLTLRYTIDEARACNMPKDTIEKAILKGTGELGGENYDSATYEGYAPGGVGLMIEVLTNNRARTAPDLRSILEKHGANFAAAGAVSFQFNKRGIITIKSDAVEEERLMEIALDAGAEDVVGEGDVFEVVTSPGNMHKIKDSIAAQKIPIELAEITFVPLSAVPVDAERARKLEKLIDALEDNDDVQSVSHNARTPDDVGD